MAWFAKRPSIIQAIQWDGSNTEEVSKFCNVDDMAVKACAPPKLVLETSEGDFLVACGDWILKGTFSELYPCDNKVFTELYQPMEVNDGSPSVFPIQT